MADQRLTYDDVRGVYAIMPTPALPDGDQVDTDFAIDLDETRRGARKLVEDDVNAIMINGTFGEASTLMEDEWREFTRTVVETVDGEIPVLAGPTTLNTRDTIRRAEYARSVGADGFLLGRPMWCSMSEDMTYQFYKDVADAVPEMGIVIYYNPSAFKNTFSTALWERLADIPQVVGAKYLPFDERRSKYPEVFEAVKGDLRLMTLEYDWHRAYELFPEDALACWSGGVSCGPRPVTEIRDALFSGDVQRAERLSKRLDEATGPLIPEGDKDVFRRYNMSMQKIRMTEAGYINAGPARPPYHVVPEEYAEGAREAGRMWAELDRELREGVPQSGP